MRQLRQHIAFVLPDLRAGGAQRVLLILAKAFVAKGYRVDIVVGINDGELLSEVPMGARLYPLCSKAPVFRNIGLACVMLLRLVRYLKKNDPDALLSTLTGTNLVSALSRRLARVETRLVLREASSMKNLRSPAYKLLMKKLYPWSDVIIALNQEMKNELLQLLGLPETHIQVIVNPIDLDRIEKDSSRALPSDVNTSVPFVLTVGRLASPKDYMTLLKAFSKVAVGRRVNLIVLGEGPDRKKIQDEIHVQHLHERVILIGYEPNPYRWMSKASVLVLSTQWEGCPNVLLEADVLGLPVVVTEYALSVHEMVKGNGEVVPVGNVDAMASAIAVILDKKSGLSHPVSTKLLHTSQGSIDQYMNVLLSDRTSAMEESHGKTCD